MSVMRQQNYADNTLVIRLSQSSDPDIKLAGAEFEVTNKETGQSFRLTTNELGEATQVLAPGQYSLSQLSTSAGYTAITGNVDFIIVNDDYTLLEFTNDISPDRGGLGTIEIRVEEVSEGTAIQNSEIEVVDDIGVTRRATSDSNGRVVFRGLPLGRRYTIRLKRVGYPYTPNEEEITHLLSAEGTIHLSLKVQNFIRDKYPIRIYIHEQGDRSISIPGAQITLVGEDGIAHKAVTDENGVYTFDLPWGVYTLTQQTSDENHEVYPEPIRFTRANSPNNVDIPNRLIDPESATRTIKATKVWGDSRPENVEELTFELLRNNEPTGIIRTLNYTNPSSPNYVGDDESNNTFEFNDVPKYDENHERIIYRVVEAPIENYYSVVERTSSDDSVFEITNYEGIMTSSDCPFKGPGTGIWVSSISDFRGTANEINPDGTPTGVSIPLGSDHGGAIALTNDGRYIISFYAFGNVNNNVNSYLRVFDTQTRQQYGSDVYVTGNTGTASDRVNSAVISPDGTELISKTWLTSNVYRYSVEEVLEAARTGSNNSRSRKLAHIGTATGTTSGGDMTFLEDGSILIAGETTTGRDNGLWVMTPNESGGYNNAVRIGYVNWGDTPNQNTRTQNGGGQGLYSINGEVYVTHTRNDGDSHVSRIINTPTSDMRNQTFTLEKYRVPRNTFQRLEDAASVYCSGTPSLTFKVAGAKDWLGDSPENRPDSIQVGLFRRLAGTNNQFTMVGDPMTFNADSNWTWLFENVDRRDSNGNQYEYQTREVGYTIDGTTYSGVPPGYRQEVDDDGYSITNIFQTTEFHLLKTDGDSDEALSDVGFTLYELMSDGELRLLSEKFTDAQGRMQFDDLELGEYRLIETTAPPGYRSDTTEYNIVVSSNNSELEVRVNGVLVGQATDNPLIIENFLNVGEFEILKVNQIGLPITDNPATFELRQGSEVIREVRTQADGRVVIEDIPQGNYTLVETEAPTNYLISDREYNVVVDEDGEVSITLDGDNVSSTPLIITNKLLAGELPVTGGIGVLPFIVIGLIIISVALFGINRRPYHDDA